MKPNQQCAFCAQLKSDSNAFVYLNHWTQIKTQTKMEKKSSNISSLSTLSQNNIYFFLFGHLTFFFFFFNSTGTTSVNTQCFCRNESTSTSALTVQLSPVFLYLELKTNNNKKRRWSSSLNMLIMKPKLMLASCGLEFGA